MKQKLCAFCLTPFKPNPRIKDHRFCQETCRKAFHRAGPSLAGVKRLRMEQLVKAVIRDMVKSGELVGAKLAVR